jgi:hypothetical protein
MQLGAWLGLGHPVLDSEHSSTPGVARGLDLGLV